MTLIVCSAVFWSTAGNFMLVKMGASQILWVVDPRLGLAQVNIVVSDVYVTICVYM